MKIPFVKEAAALLFLFSTLTLVSCNQEKKEDSKDVAEKENKEKFDTKASEKDAQFMVDIVAGNYYEIRVANSALQHSANDEVKSLAGMLVTDHTAMLNEAKNLASSKNISVPNEDSTEARKEIESLNDKKMSNYDKAWLDDMIDRHKSTISKLEDESKDGTDPDIRNMAGTALPKVRTHLDMLQQLKDKMK